MIPFTESLRYEYPLTSESLVLDCGVYEGNFAKTLAERYDCRVIGFEPIRKFHDQSKANLAHLSKVQLLNFGVGGRTRDEEFAIANDSTGMFKDKPGRPTEKVTILDFVKLLDCLPDMPYNVALVKMNTEGAEMETLERVIEANIAHRFANIQVQPHTCAPDAEARWKAIKAALAVTHEITWDEPWCWTNFQRR